MYLTAILAFNKRANPEERRLAGAVRAGQDIDAALVKGERTVFEYRLTVITLEDVRCRKMKAHRLVLTIPLLCII